MKALIFNSGIGKRMGALTHNTHKSLTKLLNNETILERQIRILSECGIKEFVITTGPFEEKLKAIANKSQYKNLKFTFVNNPIYDQTNYIYSFYLTKEYLDDDFLMMHGDLVFDKKLVIELLNREEKSIALFNKKLPLPEKDFKCRVKNSHLKEVSISIFGDDCYTFQPLYKLSHDVLMKWYDNVADYIENRKIDKVYAENALNEITDNLNIEMMDYSNYFIDEIDNMEDYQKVTNQIRIFDFNEQELYYDINNIIDILSRYNLNNPLFILDGFLKNNKLINKILSKLNSYQIFSEYTPNPKYEEVKLGYNQYIENNCDCIISIGGGSAIDVGKAIKRMSCNTNDLFTNDFEYTNIKHIVIPTTAGTGSEATRYAVVYLEGKKYSLTNDYIVPNIVIFEKELLKTLPDYQKKCTMLDALCQSIESIWSVNHNNDSVSIASKSIKLILNNYKEYLKNEENAIINMQEAAYLSGKAINITQTTAAHAMSYKITSLFNIPHGHAVALTLPYLWELLSKENNEEIKKSLKEINEVFDCDSTMDSINKFNNLYNNLNIIKSINISNTELYELVDSVNIERLKNFPKKMLKEDIIKIFTYINK